MSNIIPRDELSSKIALTNYSSLAAGERVAGFGDKLARASASEPQKALSQQVSAVSRNLILGPNSSKPSSALESTLESNNAGADFEIVWRSLRYEVERSTRDRVLDSFNYLFGKLTKLGGGGGEPSERRMGAEKLANGGATRTLTPADSTLKLVRAEQAGWHSTQSLSDGAWRRADGEARAHQRRTIFSDLNGCVRSGQLSAILGPSGAGKTSLLNAICGGKLDNYTGSIDVLDAQTGSLGARHTKRHYRLCVIPQKDYLLERLSVRESLSFASRLLNPSADFDHEANIARVVEMLNLVECLDSQLISVSGGEHKRVSIAQELLGQPDILVLDEPTSGLDSLSCERLLKCLKQLIEASRRHGAKPLAIVATIHQPDIEIFNMFDHVYCMSSAGGKVIFDGHPSEAMQMLRAHSGLPPAALGEQQQQHQQQHQQHQQQHQQAAHAQVNPANLLIKIASGSLFGPEPIERLAEQQRARFGLAMRDQLQALERRNKQQQVEVQLEQAALERRQSRAAHRWQPQRRETGLRRDKRLQARREHAGRFWPNTWLLTRRAFTATLRDPIMTSVMLLFHLLLPVAMWLVYTSRVGRVRACPVIVREFDVSMMSGGIMSALIQRITEELLMTIECSSMLFIVTYSLTILSVVVAALSFPLSMHVLLKEMRNGWYQLSSFVLAVQIASFPFEIVFPSATMMMIYYMLDMPGSPYAWRMWAFLLIMGLTVMVANSQGFIMGALCMDSPQTAVFLAVASTLPPNMVNGFSIRIDRLPLALQYMSWGSHYRFCNELISAVRYGFGLCPCDASMNEYLASREATFVGVPDIVKSTMKYYLQAELDNIGANLANSSSGAAQLGTLGVQANLSLALSDEARLDPLTQIAKTSSEALTFGRNIDGCDKYQSLAIYILKISGQENFLLMVGALLALIAACKLIMSLVVRRQVHKRL